MTQKFVSLGCVCIVLISMISAGAYSTIQALDPLTGQWTLQGRVYAGEMGDESRPLQGVTVSVYGANNPYPDSGTFIASTTTDAAGWYGLEVPNGYEYYHIQENDPWGFSSVGAMSLDGTVRTSNWIEYEIPLSGKTLTGNKFWDRPRYILSGRVFTGEVGDESMPLDGVLVDLYGSNNVNELGTRIDRTTTNPEGWYGLIVYNLWEFYTIVENDPAGYSSIGATSVNGTVVTSNRIRYAYPLEGKTLTGNKFWDHLSEELPDLIVTDVWNDGNPIYYQVMNIGTGTTFGEQYTALLVDSEVIVTDLIETTLEPRERYKGCFDHEWRCTAQEDTVVVVADYYNNLTELNEANNLREEFWNCDSTPPCIISGPIIEDITSTSAVVLWVTDEESDHYVKYGDTAGRFSDEQSSDLPPDVEHRVTLRNLEPSTTYHLIVRSTDASGNAVESKDLIFETLPAPDERDPEVTIIDPSTCQGFITFLANASDDNGVAKVEFYLNDSLLFTDYAPPYAFPIDTMTVKNGEYALKAKAYDLSGKSSMDSAPAKIANPVDLDAPVVVIIDPTEDEEVFGTINVTATVSDDTGIFAGWFYVDGNWSGTWYPTIEGVNQTTIHLPWDTTLWTNGKHRIAFEIYDMDLHTGIGYQDVNVNNAPPAQPPKLVIINHDVTRHQNYFTIDLHVKNIGGEAATNVRIKDYLQLFQPISRNDSSANFTAEFKPELTSWRMNIAAHTTISPGQTRVFTYDAVPVLIYPDALKPMVGGDKYAKSTRLWYEPPSGMETYYEEYEMSSAPIVSYENALKAADYLIVTSPHNLHLWNNNPQEVDALLSTMAELAKLENGVLGYLYGPASFPRDYEHHDGFALGDVSGDIFTTDLDEIIIADRDADMIYVYNARGTLQYFKNAAGRTQAGFACGLDASGKPEKEFEEGDRIAVGEVDIQVKEEIVMGDRDDWILIYDWKGNLLHKFTCDFEHFDGLAVGDVDDDGMDEIVIADRSADTIYVYEASGSLSSSFSFNYEAHDGFAVGDVLGDTKEEIIIADRGTNTVFVYGYTGVLLASFAYDFKEGDGLAVGDVVGLGSMNWSVKAEIIIADRDTNWISIYRGDGYGYTSRWLKLADFESFDGLAVGQVTGDPTNWLDSAEILVADRDDSIDIYERGHTVADKYVLRDLIKQGGPWSSKLKSDWASNGYLLLVGETEIIPAWGNKQWTQEACFILCVDVETVRTDCTDYPYASTAGSEIIPELSSGRIIGNTANLLRIPIETSINVSKGVPGYGFDRSSYFGMSGYPACLAEGTKPKGKCDYIEFKNELTNVALALHDKGVYGVVMVAPDYTQYNATGYVNVTATEAVIRNTFFATTTNRDVIFIAGHGNTESCDVIRAHDVRTQTNPFRTTNPFVFASSCLTGRYALVSSLAEAFLQQRAGVYLGSTESGRCCSHASISKKFFELWDTGESIGLAVKQTKRNVGNGDAYSKFWSAIYHVYGDPKFGWQGPVTTLSGPTTASTSLQGAPPSTVAVTIPDYIVTSENGTDTVDIPGGSVLFVPGMPLVPSYQVFYEYPRGYQIQDVVLTNRSGAITDTNLNLSTAVVAIPGCCNALSAQYGRALDWWPLDMFEWTVFDGPNSSTLVLTIYPFYYNNLTTDVRFFSDYQFAINYTVSNVTITTLKADKPVYELGESVEVEVAFNNGERGEIPPEGKNLVVNAVVIKECTDDVSDGLKLRTLKDFTGFATYTSRWNSSGFESGYYSVQLELRDTEGSLLDQEVVTFRLGIASGEVTNFSATPAYFSGGDAVELNMTFNNTGTVNITGEMIIQIVTENGALVEEFTQNMTDLQPSEALSFSGTWNTTEAEGGTYTVLGFVLYDGTSTVPMMLTVSTVGEGFDTGYGTYPSIAGTHDGTITPYQTILVNRLYTYPCSGTGGHAESVKIWRGSETIVEAQWKGYQGDWQNITFDAPVVLEADRTYYYTIRTGSYPQIIHESSKEVAGGAITCTAFVDLNGKGYDNWIPAIKLE